MKKTIIFTAFLLLTTLTYSQFGIVDNVRKSTTFAEEYKAVEDEGGSVRYSAFLKYNTFTDESFSPKSSDYVMQNAYVIEYLTAEGDTRVKLIAYPKTDDMSPLTCTTMDAYGEKKVSTLNYSYFAIDLADSVKCNYVLIVDDGAVTVLYRKGEINRIFKGELSAFRVPKEKKEKKTK